MVVRRQRLNGLIRFVERRYLVSACMPSHFKRSLLQGNCATHSMEQFTFHSRSSQGLVNCSSLLLNRLSVLVTTEAPCGHGLMYLNTGKESFFFLTVSGPDGNGVSWNLQGLPVKLSAGDLDTELRYSCKLPLKFGFYRAENTALLRFNDQPINYPQKNDRSLFCKLDDIHEHTLREVPGLSIL